MEQSMKEIRSAIREYDPQLSKSLVQEALMKGASPLAIVKEISEELKSIGAEFESGELFLTDLIGAATAVEEAMGPLRKKIESSKEQIHFKGTVVMGTVEGDIHSIGKNIVLSMLRANGYNVVDIGEDKPTSEFIDAVKTNKADVVGASALLSTTMMRQRDLVEAINAQGLRGNVKVVIGGAPITKEWCEEIQADGYAREAIDAVKLIDDLLKSC